MGDLMSDSLRPAEASGNSSSLENEQSAPLSDVCSPDIAGLEAAVTIRPAIRRHNSLIDLMNGRSLCAEKFRVLATRLRHIQERRELKILAVTSGMAEDGKTFVASNLAITLASHSKQKVVLLEGDLRAPKIGHQFGLNGSGGLSEFLQLETSLPEPIYAVEGLPLCVIPAGSPRENPMEVLQSGRLLTLLKKIRAHFDWVIIDSPPLLPFADTTFWARFADGVLLVVREAKTQKKLLRKGLETLDNPMIVGVVLNGSHSIDHLYYDRYSSSQKANVRLIAERP